jgi:hypothetical protein
MFPTTKLTARLFWTLSTPDCTRVDAPFGPVMVQLTVLTCCPPRRVSCIPTLPISSRSFAALLGDGPCDSDVPADEQPTAAPAALKTRA